jgi:hypothetical protein
MNKLKTINDNKLESEFLWFVVEGELLQADEPNLQADDFTIKPIDSNISGLYTIQTQIIGNEVKIVNQSRTKSEAVTGKAIFEYMLPVLYDYYNKTIISSSRSKGVKDEYLVDNVKANYEKLVKKGIVKYDESRDIYVYNGGKE